MVESSHRLSQFKVVQILNNSVILCRPLCEPRVASVLGFHYELSTARNVLRVVLDLVYITPCYAAGDIASSV
jgi:hypothetical protein